MADKVPADPAARGRTTIANAVIEHIACYAAAEVSGVAPVGSGLEKVIGRQYPKADANVAGSRAWVSLEISTRWPQPLAEVSAQVRETVSARLHELSGLDIDAVHVTVAQVLSAEREQPRRVR